MTGARVSFDLDDAALISALGLSQQRLGNPEMMLDEIGARLELSVAQRFERQQGPDGRPWKPSLRARRDGGQTLTDTARLRQSITRVVRGDELLVGTNVIYAAIHQFGGTINRPPRTQLLAFDERGRFAARRSFRRRRTGIVPVRFAEIGAREVTIPARPFLGISDRDRAAILRIVRRYIDGEGAT